MADGINTIFLFILGWIIWLRCRENQRSLLTCLSFLTILYLHPLNRFFFYVTQELQATSLMVLQIFFISRFYKSKNMIYFFAVFLTGFIGGFLQLSIFLPMIFWVFVEFLKFIVQKTNHFFKSLVMLILTLGLFYICSNLWATQFNIENFQSQFSNLGIHSANIKLYGQFFLYVLLPFLPFLVSLNFESFFEQINEDSSMKVAQYSLFAILIYCAFNKTLDQGFTLVALPILGYLLASYSPPEKKSRLLKFVAPTALAISLLLAFTSLTLWPCGVARKDFEGRLSSLVCLLLLFLPEYLHICHSL